MHSHQVVKQLQVGNREYIIDVHKINVSTAPRHDTMNVTDYDSLPGFMFQLLKF